MTNESVILSIGYGFRMVSSAHPGHDKLFLISSYDEALVH